MSTERLVHTSQNSYTEEKPEYELLVGHHRTDGSFKTDEQLRVEYLHRTDSLIHKLTHGVEVVDPQTGERTREIPDTVIFLDKSARPLAWMMRELWDRLALDDEGNVAKQPDIKFLNIDRNQWVNTLDPQGNGILDVDRVDDSDIRSLRSIFVSPRLKKDGLTEEIDNSPSSLDGKTILVVDEVHSTGRTLQIAEDMLGRAFPSAKIAGAHWMAGVATKGLATGNADLPIWYKKDDPTGRGVNDRHKQPSGAEFANITQRLGAWFLSTRFNKPDESSMKLRQEIRQLANDTSVPVRISTDRYDVGTDEGFDAYSQHIQRVNNGASMHEVQKELERIRVQKR